MIFSRAGVEVTDVDGVEYRGTLSDSAFTARGNVPSGSISPGIRCVSGTVTYAGKINGATITGPINGSFSCSGFGNTAGFRIRGSFTVSRNARQAAATASRSETIGRLVDRVF